MHDRSNDNGGVLGAIWCGTLGIILIWFLVITIVFGLLLWDAHTQLQDIEDDLKKLKKTAEENEMCCENVTDTVAGFRPCLDEYCDPANFPRLLDAVICKGCWNADTNTPLIVSGVGTNGDLYYVCVPGSTSIEGVTDWKYGDTLKFIQDTPLGPVWIKNDGSPSFESLDDEGPGLSLITGPNTLRKLIQGDGLTITDVNGTGYEISSGLIMRALGGSPPDTAKISRILEDPGTDGDFSFRGLKSGLGVNLFHNLGNVVLEVGVVFVFDTISRFYGDGDQFDAIRDDDIKTGDVQYMREEVDCILGQQRIGCLCDTQYDSPNVYLALTDVGVLNINGVPLPRGCRCRVGIIRVREGGLPQTIKLRTTAVCLKAAI